MFRYGILPHLPLHSGTMGSMTVTWQESVEWELATAREAHIANLEGRSRVSARRAAGIVIKEYFRRCGIPVQSDNFLHLIKDFSEYPGLPDNMHLIARHLYQRVDENYSLPERINLVMEAEVLIQYLKHQIENLDREKENI